MSSHEIKAREPDKYRCRVGFDPGVNSYFLYVARHLRTERGRVVGEHDGHVVAWRGTTEGEITNVEDLRRLAEPYAVITPQLLETLKRDREQPGRAEEKGMAVFNSTGAAGDGRR